MQKEKKGAIDTEKFGELYGQQAEVLFRLARHFMPPADTEEWVENFGHDMYCQGDVTASSCISWFQKAREKLLATCPSGNAGNLGDLLKTTPVDPSRYPEADYPSKLAQLENGLEAETLIWTDMLEIPLENVASITGIDIDELDQLRHEGRVHLQEVLKRTD